MSKNTPRARFARTLLASIAGYAASWAAIDWATDYRTGARVVGLNLIAASVAGTIAYLQALQTSKPRHPFGKAVLTFAQNIGAGLGTLTLAELTPLALENFGRGLVSTIVGAGLAALATLGLNVSEDSTPPPA